MSDKPFGRNAEDVLGVIVSSAERLELARMRFEEAERARAAVPPEERILDENPKFNNGFGPISAKNEIGRGEVQAYYRRMDYDPFTGEKLPRFGEADNRLAGMGGYDIVVGWCNLWRLRSEKLGVAPLGEPIVDEQGWLMMQSGDVFFGLAAVEGGFRSVTVDRGKPLMRQSFALLSEAGRFLIVDIADEIRRQAGVGMKFREWRAAGVDPRVTAEPAENGTRLTLRTDSTRTCVVDGLYRESFSHAMPLTYEELDRQLVEGIPGCNRWEEA